MTATKDEYKELIIDMSKEFDEHEGHITSEISIHRDDIDLFKDIVTNHVKMVHGRWLVTECDTCVKHKGEGWVHAEIERRDSQFFKKRGRKPKSIIWISK